ncbi:MAG: DNA mismatch endonuclease Vsr [Chloracidobacterium sp.]|nr:DNA mismatch endonuclease Vsr [Chloracidobacterium sp.]
MVDNLSPEARRRTMQAVKGKGTRIERRLWSLLAGLRVRGWRKNAPDLPGQPDAAVDTLKIAVFSDGCFWHGCPVCRRPLPETRRDDWRRKITRNIERAADQTRRLTEQGWRVVRFWEHELSRDLPGIRRRLQAVLAERKEHMETASIQQRLGAQFDTWLESCRRRGRLSRNTVAVGVVVIDHILRAETLPLMPKTVVSSGGEIMGARGRTLRQTLARHGFPTDYLKEVTTRQAPHEGRRLFEALDWGAPLAALDAGQRRAVLDVLLSRLRQEAESQTAQRLQFNLDVNESPTSWVERLLTAARTTSTGVVEQHLVGAKLELRFPDFDVSALPAHAPDQQTGRSGDFDLLNGQVVIHVTANPTQPLLEKCQANLRQGSRPIVVTLREKVAKARGLAEAMGIENRVTVFALEDYLAMNLIEIAAEKAEPLDRVFRRVVEAYNRRVTQAETNRAVLVMLC